MKKYLVESKSGRWNYTVSVNIDNGIIEECSHKSDRWQIGCTIDYLKYMYQADKNITVTEIKSKLLN